MKRNSNNPSGIISFPCHSKEKVLVYEDAKGCCSVKCPYCDRVALFNFDTMESAPSGAARGVIDRLLKKKKYID